MRITCPQCGFFRELPDTKAPVTPTMATCPKCRHRFRFRPDPVTAAPGSHLGLGEEGVSSWRRASAAKQDRQPPAAAWEPMDGEGEETLPQDVADTAGAPESDVASDALADATFAPPPSRRASRAGQSEVSDQDAGPQDAAAPGEEPDEFAPLSHWAKPVESDRPATHQRHIDPAPARARPPRTPVRPVEPEAPPAPVASLAQSEPEPQPAPPVRPVEVAPQPVAPAAPIAPAEPAPQAPVEPPPAVRAAPTPPAPEMPAPPAAAVEPDAVRPPAQPPHFDETPVAADAAAPPEEAPAVAPKPEKALRSDGVRDIWARLQAMDDRKAAKPRVEHQRPAEDEPDAPDEPAREAVTDPIPWERQDAYGFLPGLFLTLRKILLQPMDFFGALPEGRPKGKALVFNLLISEFLLVIDFMWSLFGLRARIGSPGEGDALGALGHSPSLAFLAALLLVPVVLSVGIYLDAWVTHLLLLLFRSAKKGFNETFRVLCYSAAPTVLSAVPVAGQLLSPVILIWYMALQAIGLKKCHEAAYTQTLAAIFIKWSIYLFLLLAMLQSFTPSG